MTTEQRKEPELKLLKWYNAGFPPIDLNNEIRAVIDLIKVHKEITMQLGLAEIALSSKKDHLEACESALAQRDAKIQRLEEIIKAADEVIKGFGEFVNGMGMASKVNEALEHYKKLKSKLPSGI